VDWEREGEKGGKVGTSGLLLEQGTRHTMGRGGKGKGKKLGGRKRLAKEKGRETGESSIENSTDREFSLKFPVCHLGLFVLGLWGLKWSRV
jgi:hypothetical protein